MKKRLAAELTAIYLAAALLVVSVSALAGRVRQASAEQTATDPFPNLYAVAAGEPLQPAEKTVYLTFDDGPSPNTLKILDVLAKQGVRATFFVTAQNADEPYAAEILQRIVDEGHTIGLHSYSHEFNKIYKSTEAFLTDIDKLNEYLYETVGVRPSILRFPGGSATVNASPETMTGIIREITRRGYQFYDWDVVSGDDTTTVFDVGYLSDRMVNGVEGRESAVILLHDSPAPVTTAQAVDLTIDRLREEGYRFDRLTGQVKPVHIKTNRFQIDDEQTAAGR